MRHRLISKDTNEKLPFRATCLGKNTLLSSFSCLKNQNTSKRIHKQTYHQQRRELISQGRNVMRAAELYKKSFEGNALKQIRTEKYLEQNKTMYNRLMPLKCNQITLYPHKEKSHTVISRYKAKKRITFINEDLKVSHCNEVYKITSTSVR